MNCCIYYLSQKPLTDKSAGYFLDADQIEFALSSGQIKVHSTIISRFETVDEKGNTKFEKHISTAGRFLLSNIIFSPLTKYPWEVFIVVEPILSRYFKSLLYVA